MTTTKKSQFAQTEPNNQPKSDTEKPVLFELKGKKLTAEQYAAEFQRLSAAKRSPSEDIAKD